MTTSPLIRVAPNPSTSGVFRITAPFAIATVHVLDAEGRSVFQQRSPAGRELVLDLADEPPGMYAVRLTDTNGAVLNTRIVRADCRITVADLGLTGFIPCFLQKPYPPLEDVAGGSFPLMWEPLW